MIAFLFYSPIIYSKDWYVNPDPQIGNNSNPGTITEPLWTLTYAVSVADPEDTIILREGVYYEEHDNTIHDPLEQWPFGNIKCPANMGQPEDFPIYLKQDLTITAYVDPGTSEYENVVLTTKNNCNEDILRTYVVRTEHDPLHQWTASSSHEKSKIIGIHFETKQEWFDPPNFREASG